MLAAVALAALTAHGCKMRFGNAGQDPFVAGRGAQGGPCAGDEDCIQPLSCCGGWCASCCSDVHCAVVDPCHRPLCVDGSCDPEATSHAPGFDVAVESLEEPREVLALGSMALLVLSRSLAVVDMVDPLRPRVAGSVSLAGRIVEAHRSENLVVALVTPDDGSDPEIHVVDVSLPTRPRVTVVATLQDLRDVSVSGTILAAASPSSLWVVDLSSPADPTTLARVQIPCQEPQDMASWDSEVAVACGEDGLVLVDVTDPSAPTIGPHGLVAVASHVCGVAGRWAVQDDSRNQPVLVSGSQGQEPVVTQPDPGQDVAHLVDFDGENLLVDRPDGAWLVHVPTGQETALGEDLLDGQVQGQQVLTLVRQQYGPALVVLRPGDGDALVPLVTLDLTPFTTVVKMALDGNRAVLAFRQGGIFIVDVSIPDQPRVIHSLVHPHPVQSVCWTAPREIALVDDQGLVQLLDFTDMSGPPRTRTYRPGGGTRAVDLMRLGHVLAVTDEEANLWLLEHEGLETPVAADSCQLAAASTILDAGDGEIRTLTGGPDRALQITDVRPGDMELGIASDPLVVGQGPVAVDLQWVVDADAPGALRVRARDGHGGVTGARWVESIDALALAFAGKYLWSLGPRGLHVLAREGQTLDVVFFNRAALAKTDVKALMDFPGGMAALTDSAVLFDASTLPLVGVDGRLAHAPRLLGGAWNGDDSLTLAAGAAGIVSWSHLPSAPRFSREAGRCVAAVATVDAGGSVHRLVAPCHGSLVLDRETVLAKELVCDVLHPGAGRVLARCRGEQGRAWYRVDPANGSVERAAQASGARITALSGSVVAHLASTGELGFTYTGGHPEDEGHTVLSCDGDHVVGLGGQGLFAVASSSTVMLVDASDPGGPRILDTLPTDLDAPLILAATQDRVHAVDPTGRILTVPVSEKKTLSAGQEQIGGLAGATMAIASDDGQVALVRADGEAVVRPGGGEFRPMTLLPAARRLALLHDGVWLAGGRDVWVRPVQGQVDEIAGLGMEASVTHLVASQHHMSAVLEDGRIAVLENGPEGPALRALVETGCQVRSAVGAGRALCIAAGEDGLKVVDLQAQDGPAVTASLFEDRTVLDVASDAMTCRLLMDGGEVVAVNVVDPASARIEDLPSPAPDGDVVEHASHIWTPSGHLITGQGSHLSILPVGGQGQLGDARRMELPSDVADLILDHDLLVAWSSRLWFVQMDPETTLRAVLEGGWEPGAVLLVGPTLLVIQDGNLWALDASCLVP